jgi:hypothetical protein
MVGLGVAAAAGSIGWIVADDVGAAAGVAWLIARAREMPVSTSHLSSLLAVEPGADGLTDDQLHGLGQYLSENPFLLEQNLKAYLDEQERKANNRLGLNWAM